MTFRKFAKLLIISAVTYSVSGQQAMPEFNAQDSTASSYWLLGVGINIVDDSGDAWNNFTTVKDQWNMVPFPSRISAGRYWRSGLGVELIGTYNRYKEGNLIDGVTITEDIPYWAVDTRLSYDLNKIVGHTGFFDPYLGAGLGYTDANNLGRSTYNAVVGFRLWVSQNWGVDLNSSGKWSFGDEASNHIQHAAGVVYRMDAEYEWTRRGREKVRLREELEAAMQRRNDSIQAVRDAEERQRLLEQQAEAERLAAAERAEAERVAAEARRKDGLRAELDQMGQVRYAFNSSYLTAESKAVADKVAAFMLRETGITIAIHAHADSRGPSTYNQWLSERRAQRVVDYLLAQGVPAERIQSIGHGEEQLANHCADGVRCSAAEHAVNRRCEMEITGFE